MCLKKSILFDLMNMFIPTADTGDRNLDPRGGESGLYQMGQLGSTKRFENATIIIALL